jgi:TrmH family RNA methyltransferase
MSEPTVITSRDNHLLKELRKLAEDNTAYRKTGRYWIEGDHLCSAALQRGLKPAIFVVSESFLSGAQVEYARVAIKTIVIPMRCFAISVD